MSEKRIDIDVTNIVPVSLPTESKNTTEFERSPELVEQELERERKFAEAAKLFEEGGFTFSEGVDDEGNERIAIYTNKDSSTPLHKLVELCEADMPYVDDKTKEDFKHYLEDLKIEEEEYDPNARQSNIKSIFG